MTSLAGCCSCPRVLPAAVKCLLPCVSYSSHSDGFAAWSLLIHVPILQTLHHAPAAPGCCAGRAAAAAGPSSGEQATRAAEPSCNRDRTSVLQICSKLVAGLECSWSSRLTGDAAVCLLSRPAAMTGRRWEEIEMGLKFTAAQEVPHSCISAGDSSKFSIQ